MSNTANLDLERPDKGDPDWHTSLNSNFDKLDSGYGNNVASIADLPEIYIETGTFNHDVGDVITLPKSVDAINEYNVMITPTTGAGLDIGFIYVTKAVDTFTVYCTGNNHTDTYSATIYYIGDVASYGGSIYRRWYVSPDVGIADHSDDTDVGSIAWVLDQVGVGPAFIELPGNKTYIITANDVDATSENITLVFQPGAIIEPAAAKSLNIYSPENIQAGKLQQIIDISNNSTDPMVFSMPGTVYPHWFGALGDDTQDDADEIETANNSLPAAGGTIIIPNTGLSYMADSTVNFTKDNLTIIFEGTIESTNGDAAVVQSIGDNCHIIGRAGGGISGDGTFVQNQATDDSLFALLRIGQTSGVGGDYNIVENMVLTDPIGCGILVYKTVDVKILNNYIVGGPAARTDSQHYGIENSGADGTIIKGNHIIANGTGGMVVSGIAGASYSGASPMDSPEGIIISENKIRALEHAVYMFVDGGTVSNNTIEDITHDEAIKVIGVRNTISDNTINNCVGGGISLYSSTHGIISNNTMNDVDTFGIYMQQYASFERDLDNNIIEGNIIEGKSAPAANVWSGIIIGSGAYDSDNVTIINNQISKIGGYGIYLESTAGNYKTRYNISHNIITNIWLNAIRSNGINDSIISNNMIYDPGVDGSSRGIRIDTVSARVTIDNNLVHDSSGTMTNGIYVIGDDFKITNNKVIGALTTDASIEPGTAAQMRGNQTTHESLVGYFTINNAAFVVVNTLAALNITTNSIINIWPKNVNAADEAVQPYVSARTPGTSFTATVSSAVSAADHEWYYEIIQ